MPQRGCRFRTDDVLPLEEAMRDPFDLEFLEIRDEYSESELEVALIQQLMDFLLTLGITLTLWVGSAAYL